MADGEAAAGAVPASAAAGEPEGGEARRFNSRGYPLRPHAKTCQYFVKTGTCRFGTHCRNNHPEELVRADTTMAQQSVGVAENGEQRVKAPADGITNEIIEDLARFVDTVHGGRVNAAHVDSFYRARPETNGLFIGKLNLVCARRPDLLTLVTENRSQFLITRASQQRQPPPDKPPPEKPQQENPPDAPEHKAAIRQPTESDVRLLADFVRSKGGRLMASNVSMLYKVHPELNGLFLSRLSYVCEKFPHLLRMAATDVPGSNWLELVPEEAAAPAKKTRAPATTTTTTAAAAAPRSELGPEINRLAAWIAARPNGQIRAPEIGDFYDDNPDLAGVFLGKMKWIAEHCTDVLEVLGPAQHIVLKAKRAAPETNNKPAETPQQVEEEPVPTSGGRDDAPPQHADDTLRQLARSMGITVLSKPERVIAYLEKVEDVLALDFEADAAGLSLLQVNYGLDASTVCIIDVRFAAHSSHYQSMQPAELLRATGLARILENPDVVKIVADCVPLARLLGNLGVRLTSVWEMRASCTALSCNAESLRVIAQVYETPWDSRFPDPDKQPWLHVAERPLSVTHALTAAARPAHLVAVYTRMRDDAYSTDRLVRCFTLSTTALRASLVSQASGAPAAATAIDVKHADPAPESSSKAKHITAHEMIMAVRAKGLPANACYYYHIHGHCHPLYKHSRCTFLHELT